MMDEGIFGVERLQTDRLVLVALTPAGLRAYLTNIEALEAGLCQRLSRAVLTPIVRNALRMKLDKMSVAAPEEWAWLTYWLATIQETSFGAGLAGFKGPPDVQGAVEIGYGIDPEVFGRGYTTEAASALIEWAFQTPACLRIMAPNTLKTNPASHRALTKLGMQAFEETEETISYHLTRSAFEQR
jgi:ribosomal-protein-alanine N-acetyltransferase